MGGLRLEWSSASNRVYTLQRSADLRLGFVDIKTDSRARLVEVTGESCPEGATCHRLEASDDAVLDKGAPDSNFGTEELLQLDGFGTDSLFGFDEAHEQFLEPVCLVAQAQYLDAFLIQRVEKSVEIILCVDGYLEFARINQGSIESIQIRRRRQRVAKAQDKDLPLKFA